MIVHNLGHSSEHRDVGHLGGDCIRQAGKETLTVQNREKSQLCGPKSA